MLIAKTKKQAEEWLDNAVIHNLELQGNLEEAHRTRDRYRKWYSDTNTRFYRALKHNSLIHKENFDLQCEKDKWVLISLGFMIAAIVIIVVWINTGLH